MAVKCSTRGQKWVLRNILGVWQPPKSQAAAHLKHPAHKSKIYLIKKWVIAPIKIIKLFFIDWRRVFKIPIATVSTTSSI